MQLAEDGTENRESAEEDRWNDRVSAYSDVEGSFALRGEVSATLSRYERWEGVRQGTRLTIAGFVEAVGGVAMRSKYGNFVSAILEADGSIYDQALGSADAQVWVEEHNVLSFRSHGTNVSCSGLRGRVGKVGYENLTLPEWDKRKFERWTSSSTHLMPSSPTISAILTQQTFEAC